MFGWFKKMPGKRTKVCRLCQRPIFAATARATGGFCRLCYREKILRQPSHGEAVRRMMGALQEAQRPGVPFNLAEYIALIAGVPLPTKAQRENFADYVAGAHSWYKHLPPSLPGVRFYFYIDKYAAFDRVINDDGNIALVERKEHGFHYSDLPTQEYRGRFGHLAFSAEAGTSIVNLNEARRVVPRDKVAAICGDEGEIHRIPPEILDAGAVELTAVIHTRGLTCPYLLHAQSWPDESGGRDTLRKIIARCRELQDPALRHLRFADSVLDDLIRPERERQRTEIIKAIDRVCDIIEQKRAAELA